MPWWQLDSILKEDQQLREFYATQPPVACPNDGEPLTVAPDSGELFCRFDGWRYPRDYDPNTQAGM